MKFKEYMNEMAVKKPRMSGESELKKMTDILMNGNLKTFLSVIEKDVKKSAGTLYKNVDMVSDMNYTPQKKGFMGFGAKWSQGDLNIYAECDTKHAYVYPLNISISTSSNNADFGVVVNVPAPGELEGTYFVGDYFERESSVKERTAIEHSLAKSERSMKDIAMKLKKMMQKSIEDYNNKDFNPDSGMMPHQYDMEFLIK